MKQADMIGVYNYYVSKSREIVSGYPDAVVLKTDGWNETMKDCGNGFPNDIPVLTQIGAKEEYCIEILEWRSKMAQERNPSVNVVNGDLTEYDFGRSKFDVILDLSTIDHIHPSDLMKVLSSYHRWLKSDGTLWLVVWLSYDKKWREVKRDNSPGHQYYFNIDEFGVMLKDAGFSFDEPELIHGSRCAPFLKGFVCRKARE